MQSSQVRGGGEGVPFFTAMVRLHSNTFFRRSNGDPSLKSECFYSFILPTNETLNSTQPLFKLVQEHPPDRVDGPWGSKVKAVGLACFRWAPARSLVGIWPTVEKARVKDLMQ